MYYLNIPFYKKTLVIDYVRAFDTIYGVERTLVSLSNHSGQIGLTYLLFTCPHTSVVFVMKILESYQGMIS